MSTYSGETLYNVFSTLMLNLIVYVHTLTRYIHKLDYVIYHNLKNLIMILNKYISSNNAENGQSNCNIKS